MLLGLPGLSIVLVVWAGLLGYVGKLAARRGRSVAAWTLIALLAGSCGLAAGFAVLRLAIATNVFTSNFTLLAVLMPPVLLILPMLVVVYALKRVAVNVESREIWDVHFIPHGEGTVAVHGSDVRFAWASGSVSATLERLTDIEPDGESVRVRGTTDDGPFSLSLLPRGTPNSPEGRRQQSVVLAQQLRGSVAPLPAARVVR